MTYFSDSDRPEELAALAWLLEEGSRKFYSEVSALLNEGDAASLFKDLVTAEEHHKTSLINLLKELTGDNAAPENIKDLVSPETTGDIMEGGIKVSEALQWARNRDPKEILQFAMALEANAYDLYIKMGRKFSDSDSGKVFTHLSEEEKIHLDRMARLLEKGL